MPNFPSSSLLVSVSHFFSNMQLLEDALAEDADMRLASHANIL